MAPVSISPGLHWKTPLGVFETPFQCKEQAENAFAGESNKRERISEHVPVLKSHYLGRWCEENEQESTWRTRGNVLSQLPRVGEFPE
jgi:hypothetical protein